MKRHFVVIVAIALPLLLLLGVTLTAYLPSYYLETEYDFIYATCDSSEYEYTCKEYIVDHYTVEEGKLSVSTTTMPRDTNSDGVLDAIPSYIVRVFIHDTKANESREITIEEASAYTLNSLSTSPDGISISDHYSYNGDFFIFGGGSSSYGYYLTKGDSRKKLNLLLPRGDYYSRDFYHLGWIIENKL